MAILLNQQITTFSSGYGPSFGCYPPMRSTCTIFGPAYPVAPMPMAPVPMMPMCYPMSDAMAAGYCTGAILAMPGAVQAIGDGLKWGYNHIIKPVWNGVVKPIWNNVVKPAWNFVKNDILKPIGSGLKWLWDHSLGWCLKKLQGATSSKPAEEAAEAAEEADE